MKGEDLRNARVGLGMSVYELGDALRLGADTRTAGKYVRRMESGERAVSGPVSVAIEALLSGWRPT